MHSANEILKASTLERAVFETVTSGIKIIWSVSSSSRKTDLNFVCMSVNKMRTDSCLTRVCLLATQIPAKALDVIIVLLISTHMLLPVFQIYCPF